MSGFFSKWKKQKSDQRTEMQDNTVPVQESAVPKEDDFLSPDRALDHLLDTLHELLESPNRIEGKRLFLPEWNLTITPEIRQATENSAVINFYLSSPQWDRDLFECCAGMGSSLKQAMGMATGSFLFSFIQGISLMEKKTDGEAVETVFAGKPHRWQVYVSNVVGMGDAPKLDSATVYWSALKDEIVKRLGNQKLCYVKIYGASINGEITGECRINDMESKELGAMVAKMVEKWNVKGFASHKQFFFIRQDEATALPDAYSGIEGQKLLKSKIKTAVEMFHASKEQEQYDTLTERMGRALGDETLAAECFSFLPEICAENAFGEMTWPESVEIRVGDQPPVTCYKVQLADYWNIHRLLFELFQEGVFGEETNIIYQEYISVSSIYGVVRQMMESDGKLKKEGKLTMLLFQMPEGFEIR